MNRFKLTLQELATIIAGSIVSGNSESVFTNIESLEKAQSSDVSFLGNLKYQQDFEKTQAGCVIVPKGVSAPQGSEVSLIEVENPSVSLAVLTEYIQNLDAPVLRGVSEQAFIDDSVVFDAEEVFIDSGARVMANVVIGNGSRIDSGVVIYPGVKIGENCHVQANVVIREKSQIGDRCIIQPNAVIGSDGYGYEFIEGAHKKVPQIGIVVLGDDVEIGSNTSIDRARFGETVIRKGSKIDNLVQIAHNVNIGEHCLVVSQSGVAGSSSLGNYTTIAGQSGVVGHTKVGDQIVVMARSVVTKDISEKGYYSGFPAKKRMEENRYQAQLKKVPDLLKRIKALEAELRALELNK